jgi:hypothetical protein
MTATSGNWNWSIWTSGGLAKCEIQFQSRRYESQVNKCALPDQSNVPNGPLTNQLPDAALSTRMCTIMGAIGNNQPYLILFRNWPANGKIHFQMRRSHETQSALTIPIDLLHMPGHSTEFLTYVHLLNPKIVFDPLTFIPDLMENISQLDTVYTLTVSHLIEHSTDGRSTCLLHACHLG